MSPSQWDEPLDDRTLTGPTGPSTDPTGGSTGPPDLTEAVWAVWGQVDALRKEMEASRYAQYEQHQATSAAVAGAVSALRGAVEELRRGGGGGDPASGRALVSLQGWVKKLEAGLSEDRAERQRFQAAVPDVVRKEVDRVQGVLGKEAVAREIGDKKAQDALRSAFETLRADLRAGPVGDDSERIVAMIEQLQQQVTGRTASIEEELGALRSQLGSGQDQAVQAVAALASEVSQVRADVDRARHERAASEAATLATVGDVVAAIQELRQESGDARAQQTVRDEATFAALVSLQAQLNQVREEMSLDRQLGEEFRAADAAVTEASNARLGELRELVLQGRVLQESSSADLSTEVAGVAPAVHTLLAGALGELREEEGQRAARAARRESWEAGLIGAIATVHDAVGTIHEELGQARAELAATRALFVEALREQEALAFKLPEATQEMEQKVSVVQTANVETLQRLEALMRETVSGANNWFIRTRDALMERLDQLASTLDLGIAESMVAVLEELRADVDRISDELAALGRRPNLTAQQVRKIVKETAAPEPAQSPANGKASKPVKAAKSGKARPVRPA